MIKKQKMEKDVVSVLGKCGSCGEMDFIGKDGICTQCWVKKKVN